MTGWVLTAERMPTRAEANEHGRVWIDDGLQVSIWPYDRLRAHKSAKWWHPMPKVVRPGRAERVE